MSTAKAVIKDSNQLCEEEISLEKAQVGLYGPNIQNAEKDMLNRQSKLCRKRKSHQWQNNLTVA